MWTDDKNIAQAVRVGGASLDLARFESDAHNPRCFGDALSGRIRSSLLWPLAVLCLAGSIGAGANDEDGSLPDGTEPVHANDFAFEGPPRRR